MSVFVTQQCEIQSALGVKVCTKAAQYQWEKSPPVIFKLCFCSPNCVLGAFDRRNLRISCSLW